MTHLAAERFFLRRLCQAGSIARTLAAAFLSICFACRAACAEEDLFLIKPYIQMGDKPALTNPESLELIWQTADRNGNWSVQERVDGSKDWVNLTGLQATSFILPEHKPRRLYVQKLTNLHPGKPFEYRIMLNGKPLFVSQSTARKAPDQPFRFAVFGDCGANTPAQKHIACRAFLAKPDFVLIPGDIVYNHGTLNEYMLNFFPQYNHDVLSAEEGAPFLRSTLFVAAPGNHDLDIAGPIVGRNLNYFPDGLAYFFLWSQPLNGPLSAGEENTPQLIASSERKASFYAVAGARYPRMANFSFNYGNSHYLILDGNAYMDWTNQKIRSWVEKDLQDASKCTWKFVCFHQPGFNSDYGHMREQRMRLLCDIFERQHVDVVFSGHAHSYQRTYPLRFVATKQPDGKPLSNDGEVSGVASLDRIFNGIESTHPSGVIYIISGAGGAHLTGTSQCLDDSLWQQFTYKFIAQPHSFTVCDVSGKKLTIKQIGRDGSELDSLLIEK